ncbi:PAS domain S-box-containing protein/diguanylate cyclase (GGDEF) domain-containing protein [Geoalkalibacter ferrihydriticus]|uniref:PAS domain S-box-containing protein/diguanylate cyclase (GGDEF) domain-containing protein n=1 Tax=Geoalkalibacter ferrihydriticus TaxID=392333 RepID=A0A1G9P520_9BACT|nr:sensor domain-containing diguanylate cyclase [Geoalkalibacter ferrihydriticus]SDL93653.1 PAS domain S-box-containing protein/diguanylate cyclase (GGDEF) domain-containing protein [Geoalkalibacter ferrihydriticus]
MGWSGKVDEWPAGYLGFSKDIRTIGARAVPEVFSRTDPSVFLLHEDEDLYRRLVNDAPEGILRLDQQGRIDFANAVLRKMLGFEEDDIKGDFLSSFAVGESRELLNAAFEQVTRGGRQKIDLFLQRRDGSAFWGLLSLSPLFEYTGRVRGMVAVLTDITERKQAETQMQRMAFADPLTGLPNRTLLIDRLEQALVTARREGTGVGVAFIDVDRFKQFNDQYGHAAGDALLQMVAGGVRQSLRRSDTVARWAGDEFVVVFPAVHEPGDLLASIHKVQQSCSGPLTLGDREFFCSLSIGVTLFPDDGERGDLLLHRADLAMYRAKREGGGTYRFFRPDLDGLPLEG